jgi:putative redox protein
MKSSVSLKWIENMQFKADVEGHKINLDIEVENGGDNQGAKPKPLMMVSLGGCTGIDVVSILKKMKVELETFNILIEADMTEEHPKVYKNMHVIYEFKGKDLPLDKIERAVELSREKYCGVSAMYKKAFDMTYEIKILD